MRKILLLTVCLFVSYLSVGQCPTDNLTLTTQAEVDNFAAQYPGCTDISGISLTIDSSGGSDPITNLDGLSVLETFHGSLSIRNNPTLTVLTGLQNMVMMPNSGLTISDNPMLTGFTNFLSPASDDLIINMTDNPNLQSLEGLPPFINLRTLRISDTGITSMAGMESLRELSYLRLENNTNLVSLEALANVQVLGASFSELKLEGLPIASIGTWLTGVDSTTELRIRNCNNLTDLSGLEIVEELRVLSISNNEALTNVAGLENLRLVEDNFAISGNNSLVTLDALTNITFNPSEEYGGLSIANNPLLTDLPTFSTTPFIVSSLSIGNNPMLQSLEGLEGITEVSTGLYIYRNHAVSNLDPLSAIQYVGGNLRVVENNNLENIDGLNGVTIVDYIFTDVPLGVYIEDNPVLQNLDGLSNISSVTSEAIIRVKNNSILTNLDGITNFNLIDLDSNGGLEILDNPILSVCNVPSICELLESNGPATIIIEGNASGCENEPEVILACGIDYNIVSGSIHFDFDNNGCDPNDSEAGNIMIETTDGSSVFRTLTNSDGVYQNFVELEGNVTTSVVAASLPPFFEADPASAASNFVGFGNEDVIDFCLEATDLLEDLKVSIVPFNSAVPGFDAVYEVIFENVGSVSATGSVSFTFNELRQTYVGSIPSESQINGETITWDYTDLEPFESRTIQVVLNMLPPPANESGDILNYSATILPVANDINPDDNDAELVQEVVNSQDPNDKQVAQGLEIDEAEVGEYLDYIVRFQNLGTADAINVRIEDELSANLDWNSIRILNSNHDFRTQIVNGNEVSFIFDDINLPPEINDPEGSKGYIAFQVRSDNTLVLGDEISNNAAIYFDFNAPVITNTITTVVGDQVAPMAICQPLTVSLDATGQVTITASEIDNGSNDQNGIASLELDITNFDCSNLDENTVTLTVTDTYGNVSECTAIVTVIDDLAPQAVCQSIVVSLDANGIAVIDPILLIDMSNSSDNCGIELIEASVTEVDCGALTTPVEVTVVAEDSSGNIDTCTTTISAIDELPPVFDSTTLPQDQSRLTDATGIYLLEDFTAGVFAEDNCTSEVILTQSPAVNEPLPPGVYDVTIAAIDEFSNDTDYSFELTVELLLGSNDFNIEKKITLSPNPVSNMLLIDLSNGLQLESITIYSIHGKRILTASEEQINLTHLSEGMYFARIETDHGSVTKKIIKN